ncbi:CNOT9-like protein [Mya arenaria]|uniref:CCR4-NOT transcription complex subunit 9 n=1 Tax=Mya arenaria TaxID=6604 RepID=A0ABY7DBJ1_MYAAR|nr:CNOT9-like protein [Mya arenaria]
MSDIAANQSRMMNPGAAPPTSGSGSLMAGSSMSQAEREKVYQWIGELTSPDTRENALQELSKKREVVPDLAPMLWHSFGTVAALLQEIVHVYPAITPPHLTAHQSNRVCNALALLQCVASHPETRSAFLTEIIPLCLRIMESGSELSKTGKMVLHLSREPSARLLKHVVRCYLRLSDNPRAREALRQCLPDQLKDSTFVNCLKDDNSTKRWLAQLQQNLETPGVPDPRNPGMPLHQQY